MTAISGAVAGADRARPLSTRARRRRTLGRALRAATVALALAVGTATFAEPAVAQGSERARVERQPPRSVRPPQDRRVEQRVQERISRLMRERLQLSDQQMTQLRAVNDKLGPERMAVREAERELRVALRQELLAGAAADETRVAELLERLPEIERRRIALVEAEQRELAAFLSPVQRARYIALQEEVRRGLEELQRRRQQRRRPLDRP